MAGFEPTLWRLETSRANAPCLHKVSMVFRSRPWLRTYLPKSSARYWNAGWAGFHLVRNFTCLDLSHAHAKWKTLHFGKSSNAFSNWFLNSKSGFWLREIIKQTSQLLWNKDSCRSAYVELQHKKLFSAEKTTKTRLLEIMTLTIQIRETEWRNQSENPGWISIGCKQMLSGATDAEKKTDFFLLDPSVLPVHQCSSNWWGTRTTLKQPDLQLLPRS